MTTMSIDDFLGHKTRSGNDGGAFLDNWKARKPPYVDTFLSCNAPIIALWQHPWPKIVERDKDGVHVREVWSGQFNSWEPEEVLKSQYKRDRETKERDLPPTICPMSLMIETVYQMVLHGELDWCDELFRFEGDDSDKAKVLHAGGLWNAFGKKELTPEQKLEMKRAGIFAKDAWQENMQAKCSYVFQVVDVSAPEKGLQIAVQGTLLGDCVKTLIGDAMVADGPEKGNPLKNPYCIRWEHRPNETEFNKKYHALRMTRITPTDEILELIEGPALDTDRLVEKGNITELRQSMEAHYIGPVPLPWDEIFGPAERVLAEEQGQTAPKQATRPTPAQRVAETARKSTSSRVRETAAAVEQMEQATKAKPATTKPAAKKQPEPVADEDYVECDKCGKDMLPDEMICPHCGHDYNPTAAEPEPEPEIAPRARRSAAAPAAAAKTPMKAESTATPGRRVKF